MRLLDVDRFAPESVDDEEVIGEHVRALVIFRGNVLREGGGERDVVGSAKGDLEDVTAGVSTVSDRSVI